MSIRSEGLESVSELTRTAPTAIAAGTISAKARKVSTVSMGNAFARTMVKNSVKKCMINQYLVVEEKKIIQTFCVEYVESTIPINNS
jgi:hypothetical protein